MTKTARKDGRNLRAERSRAAVANAALELIRAGNPRPTAAEIAETAGVSLRLVFHHYKDVDALRGRAVALQFSRVLPLETAATTDLPFDKRLNTFTKERFALYNEIADVLRVARAMESSVDEVAEQLQELRALTRKQAAEVFAPELTSFKGAERRERTTAVQVATSFGTWESLVMHHELPENRAIKAVRWMIRQSVE